MKKVKFFPILFLVILIFSELKAQDDKIVKFAGVFPKGDEKSVLITIKQVKSKLTAALKYDSISQAFNFEGYINKENVFKLYQLDNDSNRTGVSIKGTIHNGRMQASYFDKAENFDFEFLEVDTDNPDGILKHTRRKNDDFVELEKNFKALPNANIVINYDDYSSPILVGESPFLDKTITKVSSYSAPFTINERLQYLQKHAYGKKILFDEGAIGLMVYAYYYSIDGSLFNTYLFIYNEYGDFVQAIILFESSNLKNKPNIQTKFSMSQIFSLTDFSLGADNPVNFKINKDGNLEILDR